MPTGYACISTDDQSLDLRRGALILLGRTRDKAGVGLTSVEEIGASSSGGRPVLHVRT